MANAAQIEIWDGPGGEHWAAEAERFDRVNGRFADRIVAALDPKPGETILDVGCGNGALALALAPRVEPGGSVTGLDISSPMLAVARDRASDAGLANVTFEHADAQVAPLPAASFDAVVSRFGVMFFDDPTAAFTNFGGALKSGGRLTLTCWRDLIQNEWIIVPVGAALQHVPMPTLGGPGAPGPFSLADPDALRTILEAAGFVNIELEEVSEPMVMGTSLDDTMTFLQKSDIAEVLMKDVPEDVAAQAWAAVREALAPHTTDDGVTLNGTAWLVTAHRP
jgi:SAM-dependent methyltransferase